MPRARPHPRNPQRTIGSDIHDFLAWPAAASALTLLSAACLLGGAWGVVAPTIGNEEQASSRFGVIGILVAYLATLLGVVWAMCRWESGNRDAIGASVVGAASVIGLGVALDLVAVDRPGVTVLLAIGGLGAALAGWKTWNRTTAGSTPASLRWPLMMVVGWSFIGPAVMGVRAYLYGPYPVGDPALHPMLVWLLGWWLTIIGAALVLVGLARGANPWTEAQKPYLSRPAMRWVQMLIILVAAGLHQFVLGYTANLDFTWCDFAPLVAVLVLIGNEMRAAAVSGNLWRDTAACAAPVALVVVLVAAGLGDVPSGDVLNRGPDTARMVLQFGQSPQATLVMLALGCTALWWRVRRPGLLLGAATAATAAVLVWDASAPGTTFNGTAALASGAIFCASWAAWYRHPRLALLAVLMIEATLVISPGVAPHLIAAGLSPVAVASAMIGLTVMLTGSWVPALVTPTQMRLTTWLITIGVLHCCLRQSAVLYAPVAPLALLAVLLVFAAWRRKDLALVAPLAVPSALATPWLIPANKAWLGVWAAFGLLGIALAVGRRRIITGRRSGTSVPTTQNGLS